MQGLGGGEFPRNGHTFRSIPSRGITALRKLNLIAEAVISLICAYSWDSEEPRKVFLFGLMHDTDVTTGSWAFKVPEVTSVPRDCFNQWPDVLWSVEDGEEGENKYNALTRNILSLFFRNLDFFFFLMYFCSWNVLYFCCYCSRNNSKLFLMILLSNVSKMEVVRIN